MPAQSYTFLQQRTCIKKVFIAVLLFFPLVSFSQSISGYNCVAGGNTYGPYTINGVSWNTGDKWCVTGGTINSTGSSCMNNDGSPNISITWNPYITSGSVSYYHPASAPTPIATLNVSFLNPGSVSPSVFFVPSGVPTNITINNSTSAVSCNAGSILYQWQVQASGGSFTNVGGATSASLSLTNVTFAQAALYRRGAYSTIDPSRMAFTIPVNIIVSVAGIVTPTTQTINYNQTPTTLQATSASGCNGPFNYFWQSGPDGTSWPNTINVNSLSYSPPTPTLTAYYYRIGCTCMGNGSTVFSSAAVINVLIPLVSGTVTPATQTININTVSSDLTSTAPSGGNGTFTYQWQSSSNGTSGWTDVSAGTGATTLTYSPGILSATTYYRIATTSNGATVYSNLVVVNISPTTIYGVAQPNYNVGSPDLGMNWTISRSFDPVGNITDEDKKFFDNNGELLQSQNKIKYRKDASTVYTHVFASQSIADVYNRPVATSLSAPIDNSEFIYVPDFVRTTGGATYTYKNFDRYKQFASGSEIDKTNNPDPVGSIRGTLGWYYNAINIWEPYVATTDYPYSRGTIYRDGTGNAKKSAAGGDVLKMGSNKESSSFITPVINELDEYIAIRNKFFPSELGNTSASLSYKAIQTISRDANGREVVVLEDKDGKQLMAGRPGTELTVNNTVTLQPAYIYSFQGNINGSNVKNLKIAGNTITIYESTDNGTSYALHYSGAAASYASPPSLPNLYKIVSNLFFSVSFDVPVTSQPDRVVCKDCPAESNGFAFHYLKLFSASTVTISGGSFSIYDMNTEQFISFTSGSSLTAGYYKILNAATTPITLTYTNGYADVSYSYYNQLGQMVASISPEGVKKLHGSGINSYAIKTDVPFIILNEYDLQGRLVKATSTDGGMSEFVYRQDGKIRFSQNEEQRVTGRYSYTNYDGYGRTIESGEYQPDASGIAFNGDMAASSNAMRDILENTTGTGGLTTGSKKDVVQMIYDVTDATNVSNYNQDAVYLAGAISTTKKYSIIVNNVPNSNNMVQQTWYNYDEEGNMVWQIEYIIGLSPKTFDFVYDNMGRMIKKIYQKNTTPETFSHYFQYDPVTQKLWKVYTSTIDNPNDPAVNPANWNLQATYVYYLHGPLKRVELGGDLQGIDYSYTLQGQLKAINNSDKTKDPGGDGSNGILTDAFGMVLDYYGNDYVNGRSGVQPLKGVNTSGITSDSYTGQIKAMTWFSKKPFGGNDDPLTYVYKYDDKYQFTESVWGTGLNFANSPASFTQTSFNKETIYNPSSTTPAYDANGNLKFLQRTDQAGSYREKLTYNYFNTITTTGSNTDYNTNRLYSVIDDATGTPATVNYTYDKLGQVITENTGNPSTTKWIKYDVTGKVIAVARDGAFTQMVAEFMYDEKGQRIIKRLYNGSYQLIQNTYYVGDVVYTQSVSGGIPGAPVVQEYDISGANEDRLGVYFRQLSTYAFELTDHLGNTRAVVAKNGSTLDVRTYTDYYPYGMVAQRSGTAYRYGYQGKYAADETMETGWNAFELRMYDSKLGKWFQYDPAGQFNSPYVGMGNNPANGTDPDGGFFVVDDFLVGFFRSYYFGKSDNNKERFSNALKEGAASARNMINIWEGMFSGSGKQIVSRLTWELPQTLVALVGNGLYNYLGQISRVRTRRGVTEIRRKLSAKDEKFMNDYKQNRNAYYYSAFTAGSFINYKIVQSDANLSAYPDMETALIQHESGHYLQSRAWGLFYPFKVIVPSLTSATIQSIFRLNGYHAKQPWEMDADRRAATFFGTKYKQVP